jgi:dienelactone hydrolase
MKLALLVFIACLLSAATAMAGPRTVKTINRDWTLQYFPVADPDLTPAQLDYDDSRWPAIALPEQNSRLDTRTGAYRGFVDRITTLVIERDGRLLADDYNFLARAYGRGPEESNGAEERRSIKSTLFVPDPLPALEIESFGQFEPAPGVVAERVSYATGYGLRVPAIVYRPKEVPRGKMPGMVVVNGHGGDKYSWYAYYAGILYARAGAMVLTYDPLGEGERNAARMDGTRQHDRLVEPPEMARRLSGLMVTDAMQAVSYLSARPDVDTRRIAAVGYSMGSFVLALACAVDMRVNACVLAGGGNLDGADGYWDSSNKKMCQAIPYQSLKFLGDRGAALYSLHAERGGTLIINGSADDVVAMAQTGPSFFEDLRRRTLDLRHSNRNLFDVVFVPGGGHRPYFLTRPAALWLAERLKFPYWTAGSVAGMPETHIADWALRNAVTLDKLYAAELREGGTQALGANIPALSHDLLDSLPREQWERDKDKYVYETWLKNAGRATSSAPPR